MTLARVPSQVPTNFTVVDITALATLPRNTVQISFRITTAGTMTFQGYGGTAYEREMDTGTYTLVGQWEKIGPGTTATIAVFDPVDEIVAESVAGPPA